MISERATVAETSVSVLPDNLRVSLNAPQNFASSAESVGRKRLGKFTHSVKQGDFFHFEAPIAVCFSGSEIDFAIESLNDS